MILASRFLRHWSLIICQGAAVGLFNVGPALLCALQRLESFPVGLVIGLLVRGFDIGRFMQAGDYCFVVCV